MPYRVLIVDDEENIIISLDFLMKQAGYRTAIARDGHQAMEQITKFQPHLLILDVMLPGIDGFEICQRVRASKPSQELKIVMLTAKGREVEVAKGISLGADAYITKPFSTKELLTTVQHHLSTQENIS